MAALGKADIGLTRAEWPLLTQSGQHSKPFKGLGAKTAIGEIPRINVKHSRLSPT